MKISTSNEWESLKTVLLGTAQYANWPTKGSFRTLQQQTLWNETPVPSGPVPDEIINETNEGLNSFQTILESLGVKVLRPDTINWQTRDAMSAYNPRDRLLVVGDCVVDCNMQYEVRDQEIEAYNSIVTSAKTVIKPPSNIQFDAANICRINDTLLYLVSPSGSIEGAQWLQDQFPHLTVETTSVYGGVHIDSTFTPVREGLVVINSDRVNETTCPKCFKSWDKIWIGKQDLPNKPFFQYPYASNYIYLNFLMVSSSTAIIDE